MSYKLGAIHMAGKTGVVKSIDIEGNKIAPVGAVCKFDGETGLAGLTDVTDKIAGVAGQYVYGEYGQELVVSGLQVCVRTSHATGDTILFNDDVVLDPANPSMVISKPVADATDVKVGTVAKAKVVTGKSGDGSVANALIVDFVKIGA